MHVPYEFTKRIFIAALAIIILWFLFLAQQVLLLSFAGLVIAVVLGGLAKTLADHLPWPKPSLRYPVSLGVVGLAVLLLLTAASFLVAPRFVRDIRQLTEVIPDAIEQIKQFPPVEAYLANGEAGLSSDELKTLTSSLSSVAQTVAAGTIYAVTAFVFVIFIGLFAAAQPSTYLMAICSFFPPSRRKDCEQVILSSVKALMNWLKGQGLAMLIVGSLSTIGLLLIDVRYAITLGILAGLFQFVPYLGPILSAVPALLVALTMSPETTLWVALLYLGIQFTENNFITPMVMKKEANLPPLATLLSTILFGAVFGILGAIIATPLAIVLMSLKQEVYNKRILGSQLPEKARISE